MSGVEIRIARDGAELGAAMALRDQVFVGEQGVPRSLEVDDRDAAAAHLVAVRDGSVIGTARLLEACGAVELGRLVVAPGARRQGIARAILDSSERWARERGSSRIVLSAQTYARELYAGAGYEARGTIYLEAGIEHIRMERDLA